MITVNSRLAIPEQELEEHFIRSAGPGGQNVNKVATAVQLRFDVRHSPSLPEDVRARLIRLAGHRCSEDGVLIITARRFRTQDSNRRDARERLADLVRQAAERPKVRHKTRPTRASKRRRLEGKQRQAVKKQRRRPAWED